MWINNQKLGLLIAERGITIKALCMESGMTQAAICKLLKGNHKPRLSTFGHNWGQSCCYFTNSSALKTQLKQLPPIKYLARINSVNYIIF